MERYNNKLENLSKYLKLKQLVIPKTNLILPLENSNLPLINITNNNYILYNQITSDDYKITDSISHYYKITEEQVNLLITDLFNIINKNNNLYEEILKKLNISSFFEHEDLNQKKIDFKNIILSLLNYPNDSNVKERQFLSEIFNTLIPDIKKFNYIILEHPLNLKIG